MGEVLINTTLDQMQNRINESAYDLSNLSVPLSEALEPPLYIVLTSTFLYCLIFIIGIVGNSLVIIVILVSRSMKTTVNKYLLNLCVADVLVIIVCMPTALADIFTKEVWYFGEFMCKFVPFLENTIANASVLTILAISIERYRVICYPLKGIDETAVKVWKIVLVIWITSVASSVPWLTIAIFRPSTFYDGTPIQVCRNPIIKNWQKVYVVGLAVIFFLIPSILMCLLNFHLCRILNKTRDSFIHENRRERKRTQHQVANTIASIVTIFFVCHLPFRVAVLWFSFADKNVIWGLGLERFLIILYSTRIMFYINHALNPVVYNFVSSKFRSALRVACTKTSRNNCFSWSSLNRRDRTRGSRSLTRQQRGGGTQTDIRFGTKQVMLGKTGTDAGERNTTRRVVVEYPYDRNKSKKLIVTNCSSNSKTDSSLSDDEYKIRIQIEDKSVAIKFKLTRIPSMEEIATSK